MALPIPAGASAYARQSLATGTLEGYRSAWDDFLGWCRANNASPLPATPDAVADYLASLAVTHGRSALRRRLSAIGQAHRLAGHPWDVKHPKIHHTLRGILRQHGRPARQAAALTTAEITKLVATCRDDLVGLRDRAMLLIGYAGALRRSELVAIEREHLTFDRDGLRLHLPRSKTDQEGQGTEIGIPYGAKKGTCPIRALQAWLEVSQCEYGPVFRRIDMWGSINDAALHPDAVRQILKRRAEMAGLTVSIGERLSPHGLRSGFVTAAYKAGVPDEVIMGHTRHKDHATMRKYVRRAGLIDESPVKKLGL